MERDLPWTSWWQLSPPNHRVLPVMPVGCGSGEMCVLVAAAWEWFAHKTCRFCRYVGCQRCLLLPLLHLHEHSCARDFGGSKHLMYQSKPLGNWFPYVAHCKEGFACTFLRGQHTWRKLRISKCFSAVIQTDNFIPSNLKKATQHLSRRVGTRLKELFLKSKPRFWFTA